MEYGMMFLIFVVGGVSLVCFLVISYINKNCHQTRLIQEYLSEQFKKYGFVYDTLDARELIEMVGSSRLRVCYGLDMTIENGVVCVDVSKSQGYFELSPKYKKSCSGYGYSVVKRPE